MKLKPKPHYPHFSLNITQKINRLEFFKALKAEAMDDETKKLWLALCEIKEEEEEEEYRIILTHMKRQSDIEIETKGNEDNEGSMGKGYERPGAEACIDQGVMPT